MYTNEPVAPLAINTKANPNAKGALFTTATFQYTEQPPTRKAAATDRNTSRQRSAAAAQDRKRLSPLSNGMSGMPVNYERVSGMYVRALYDYNADDATSLSFHQGDIIEVINQLASGWWDGILNNVRGWFPSNYCVVVTGLDDGDRGRTANGEIVGESGAEEVGNDFEELVPDGHTGQELEQEEAAFWIPQATPHGRLFYFNTLTGVTTMELPLETPTSADETGPRDRWNIHVPDQTRPPPEIMAGGVERDEDDYSDGNSVSEADGESMMRVSRGSVPKKRRSYISDGVSPAASFESLNSSPVRHRNGNLPSNLSYTNLSMEPIQSESLSASMSANGPTATSFTNLSVGTNSRSMPPPSSFNDESTAPLTWNILVENMRKSIELYRQAMNNVDRSEYVRRAEDVSDHLRLLLAAGSGTTDNHSGNPSVISTNKALYPHFRDMMSRFSKLVLSSHIAAADWPVPDSYAKCLQEAEGVLNGVYGYAEVARSQRGEIVPRLTPGFVLGSRTGGNWRNNNLVSRDPKISASFMDQDESELSVGANTPLDNSLLERLDDLKRLIVSSTRRLDELLVLTDKLVTPMRHQQIGNSICVATGKLIELCRPWMSTIESIDLSSLNATIHNPQLTDFSTQKQRLYDLTMGLLVAAQAVAAPLGDEWAEIRGESLDDRLKGVHDMIRQLETSISQIGFTLQLLHEVMPQESPVQRTQDARHRPSRQTHGVEPSAHSKPPASVKQPHRHPQVANAGHAQSYPNGVDPATEIYRKDNSKVKKFFGEVPAPAISGKTSDELSILKLDHEGEISYDTKAVPPQLRGGTLTALVEQLTRHDRLDSPFNNTFLLTYRSFTTAPELFEMLVKRFSIQPPRNISEADYKIWVDRKQKPIRFRVVNILKSWFDHYWMETNDQASMELLRRVYSFAKESVATTSTPGSNPLMAVIDQRLRGQDPSAKKLIPTLNTSTPTPIMPKNMKKLKFLDIDATEFARQLTIIESRLYAKIKPTECLNKTWQRKVSPSEPEPAANVKALILHSNQLTNWVAEMILTQSDVKKRVVVIKHFVSVADVSQCVCSVRRIPLIDIEMPRPEQLLHADIDHLRSRHCAYTSLDKDMGSSQCSHVIRTRTNASLDGELPKFRRIPRDIAPSESPMHSLLRYLPISPSTTFHADKSQGVYLTDLTFIEDGIPSVIKRTNLINFAKRAKTAEVIRDIQQYQNVPYPLQPVNDLQDYILSNMQGAGDVHEMYEKSLAVEPREREDEKIARYIPTFSSQSGLIYIQ